MKFEHNLAVVLNLEADGKNADIPAGNIESIKLDLHSYGHKCQVQFSGLSDDEMDQLFISPKFIKATLTFKSLDPLQAEPLLEIKGIVTGKTFRRMPSMLEHFDQTIRYYDIYFCDNAKAIWDNHFPIKIYLEETMKDVIEKHKNPEISIKYDWDKLEEKRPIIAFSLPHRDELQEGQQVNFYSFIMWYLHQENGILNYDYKTNTYSIVGKKKEAEGEPLKIFEGDVNPPLCLFPQLPRYNVKKINHSSDTVDFEDKENEHAFQSVHRESIQSAEYFLFPEQITQAVHSTLHFEHNEVNVNFVQFADPVFLDKLVPDSFVCFKGNGEGNWSRDPCFKDKTFRVRSLYVEIDKNEFSQELIKEIHDFQLRVNANLEMPEETFVDRPHFNPPHYPFSIQGKVFCDLGEEEQSTYKILEAEASPLGLYLVVIPLAGEEKKVIVPFTPDFMNGQYYFPLCKDEKVLISVYFGTAKIQRTIDWQPLARLPMGVQANQIVMGSNGKDKYVIMRHEFEGGKDAVLTIKQSSSDVQTQTMQFKDKQVLFSVDEKDKWTNAITMNEALTVTLEDKAKGTLQQIHFDNEAMTHTCKGSAGTSTIVQKADSIEINCKKFVISAETVVLDAKDSISQKGKNKVNIETKVANIDAPSVKLGS